MKRAKLVTLVALAALALASCDAMLEAMFPEFGSDDKGNFGQKTIRITVIITDDVGGSGDYRPTGPDTAAPVRVIAVQWSFDQFGLPTILKNGEGDLDQGIQAVIWTPQEIPPSSGVDVTLQYDLQVPNGNYGVLVFEDEDDNGVPSDGETTAIAQWFPPPSFMYGPEEFDFFFMEQEDPAFTTMIAHDIFLLHHGWGEHCAGSVVCGNFGSLF